MISNTTKKEAQRTSSLMYRVCHNELLYKNCGIMKFSFVIFNKTASILLHGLYTWTGGNYLLNDYFLGLETVSIAIKVLTVGILFLYSFSI